MTQRKTFLKVVFSVFWLKIKLDKKAFHGTIFLNACYNTCLMHLYINLFHIWFSLFICSWLLLCRRPTPNLGLCRKSAAGFTPFSLRSPHHCFCSIVFDTGESVTVLMRRSDQINESAGLSSWSVSTSLPANPEQAASCWSWSCFKSSQFPSLFLSALYLQMKRFHLMYELANKRIFLMLLILQNIGWHIWFSIIWYPVSNICICADTWRRGEHGGSNHPDQVHQVIMVYHAFHMILDDKKLSMKLSVFYFFLGQIFMYIQCMDVSGCMGVSSNHQFWNNVHIKFILWVDQIFLWPWQAQRWQI